MENLCNIGASHGFRTEVEELETSYSPIGCFVFE